VGARSVTRVAERAAASASRRLDPARLSAARVAFARWRERATPRHARRRSTHCGPNVRTVLPACRAQVHGSSATVRTAPPGLLRAARPGN